MKREFLRELGIDKETEDKIMAEQGRDIQAEKENTAKVQRDLEDLTKQLETYKAKAADLEKAAGDHAGVKKELDDLKAKIAEEKAAAEKKAADEQLTATIRAAFPQDRKFVNDYTEQALISQIKGELSKKENAGKGVSEIFAALTKDKDGIFANPNPITPLPPMGDPGEPEGSNEAAMRRIFGLEHKEK